MGMVAVGMIAVGTVALKCGYGRGAVAVGRRIEVCLQTGVALSGGALTGADLDFVKGGEYQCAWWLNPGRGLRRPG